jgi:hypothetical protein
VTLLWGRSLAWSGCQRLETTDEPGALEVVGSNPTDPITLLDSNTTVEDFQQVVGRADTTGC